MQRDRAIAPPTAMLASRLLILGGLMAGFGVRLHRLGSESLWYDETVSVYLARLPLGAMLAHTAGDIHPPGYYALLHLWHSLTHPSLAHGLEFLYAWPSLVFGLLLLPLLFLVARRLAGLRTAVAVLWLAAFNPFLVWYSQEVRMYSLGAALGLLCLYALLQWLGNGGNNHRTSSAGWLTVYVLAAAAGLYTLYYFLLLLIALNLIALTSLWLHETGGARRRRTVHWLAVQPLVLLLWSPWLPVFWRQTTQPPVPPWRTGWETPAQFVASLSETLAAPLVGQTPPGALTWPWALVALLLLLALALLVTRRATRQTTDSGRRRVQQHAAVLVLYLLGPTVILYAVTSLGAPIYHVRYLSLVAPLFLLIPATLLVGAWKRAHWLGAAVWLGLLGVSALSLVTYWTDPLYRSDDHRQAVADLAHAWRPGDAILANAGWVYPVLALYWPAQPAGESGSAPPPLQAPLSRLLDYAQNAAPAPLTQPHIVRSGSVDGPPSLGWGSPTADFFAIDASDTRTALNTIAASARRIWHYRLYDTVSDPQGVIRQWFSDHTAPLLDSPIPGRDFGRLQLFGTGLVSGPLPGALPGAAPGALPQATFGGALALLDASAPPSVTAGSYLYFDLLWQALPPLSTLPSDLSTSLRLYDGAGQQVAQADGPPGFGPTRGWTADTAYTQAAALPVPAGLGAGPYSLQVIVYRQDDAQPLALDGSGEHAWQIGQIAVEAADVR